MRAFIRRHADVLAIFAMTSLMLVGVWQAGEQRDADRRAADAAACERGNIQREYLAFDNAETILVLRAGLQRPQDALPPERRAREDSLARRIEAQKLLVPFPCDTLR